MKTNRLTFLFLVLVASTLAAQEVPLIEKEQAAFQRSVSHVANCVVQIETFGGLEKVGDDLVAEGPTTGTILTPDGWIISSLFSFRQQPASILVSMPNGERVAANMVARDYSREIALLKVDGFDSLPVAEPADIGTDLTGENVGSWVVALGKTYDRKNVSQSVGILSAVDRAYGKAIQADAKISPINYGGPLVNLKGKVLGILAPISPGTFFDGDSSELYDSGIGFAIPLQDILERLPRLQAGEDLRSGKLGIVTSTQNELAGPVEIVGSLPGSPAGKLGLQKGDRIVEAEGKTIELLANLRHAMGPIDAGNPFHFTIDRKGEQLDFSTQLVEKIPTYRRRYLGLRLDKAQAEEPSSQDIEGGENEALNDSDSEGMPIATIEVDSPAAKAELQPRDRLISINGEKASLEELRSSIAVAELDTPIQLLVQRKVGDKLTEVQLSVQAEVLPDTISANLPAADPRLEESMQCTLVDLNLNDVPNDGYAVVPPLSDKRVLGLLIVFPEPGKTEREKTQNFWQAFAREQGWIIVVIHSANPNNWSREEFELAPRILGRMQKAYDIDPLRVAFCGLGVGGRITTAVAVSMPDRIQGVVMVGTQLRRAITLPQNNFPLRSIDFLLVGESDKFEEQAKSLRESGYSAIVAEAAALAPKKWETVPADPLFRWLEGLGRL